MSTSKISNMSTDKVQKKIKQHAIEKNAREKSHKQDKQARLNAREAELERAHRELVDHETDADNITGTWQIYMPGMRIRPGWELTWETAKPDDSDYVWGKFNHLGSHGVMSIDSGVNWRGCEQG